MISKNHLSKNKYKEVFWAFTFTIFTIWELWERFGAKEEQIFYEPLQEIWATIQCVVNPR